MLLVGVALPSEFWRAHNLLVSYCYCYLNLSSLQIGYFCCIAIDDRVWSPSVRFHEHARKRALGKTMTSPCLDADQVSPKELGGPHPPICAGKRVGFT